MIPRSKSTSRIFTPRFVPAHYNEGWPYQPDLCPADDHLIEWWQQQTDYAILFHMGPGLHHKVASLATPFTRVFSYTVSPQEVAAYAQLPHLTRQYYHCYQRDVNDSTMKLPNVDVATLFHLGEYTYLPELTEQDYINTIKRFEGSLWPGGVLIAYTGSSAADRIIPIFDKLYPNAEDFKSLRIYHP